MRRWRRLLTFVTGMALAPFAIAGQAPGCSSFSVPTPPGEPRAAADSSPSESEYLSWSHAFEREIRGQTRGVGILEAVYPSGPPAADWVPNVSVPFYGRPGDSAPFTWMHRGWWVSNDDQPARAVTYRGMMEVGYEEAGLVVVESRSDGWLQVWIDIGPIPRAASHGLAWTHRCALGLGSARLELSLWKDRFVGPGAPPLSFLGEERHALRSAATPGAPVVAWLEPEDEVELIEVDGDWARVRASSPGRYLTGCLGEEWDGVALDGWVKWFDADEGPWIWYPTRGC